MIKGFKNIFPHGNERNFKSLLKRCDYDVDFALYSYGEIRDNEYIKEKKQIKQQLKNKRW